MRILSSKNVTALFTWGPFTWGHLIRLMVLIGTNQSTLLYPFLQILRTLHILSWSFTAPWMLLLFRKGDKEKESHKACQNLSGGATQLSLVLWCDKDKPACLWSTWTHVWSTWTPWGTRPCGRTPALWKLTTSLRSHQQNLQDTMALRPLLQRYFTHQNPLIFPESRGLRSLF